MYETHYETLRSQMLGSTAVLAHRGLGLATMLQTGVPGWLRAVGSCVSAAPSDLPSAGNDCLSDRDDAPMPIPHALTPVMMPPASYTEAARLIASLVLSAHALHGPRRERQGVSP